MKTPEGISRRSALFGLGATALVGRPLHAQESDFNQEQQKADVFIERFLVWLKQFEEVVELTEQHDQMYENEVLRLANELHIPHTTSVDVIHFLFDRGWYLVPSYLVEKLPPALKLSSVEQVNLNSFAGITAFNQAPIDAVLTIGYVEDDIAELGRTDLYNNIVINKKRLVEGSAGVNKYLPKEWNDFFTPESFKRMVIENELWHVVFANFFHKSNLSPKNKLIDPRLEIAGFQPTVQHINELMSDTVNALADPKSLVFAPWNNFLRALQYDAGRNLVIAQHQGRSDLIHQYEYIAHVLLREVSRILESKGITLNDALQTSLQKIKTSGLPDGLNNIETISQSLLREIGQDGLQDLAAAFHRQSMLAAEVLFEYESTQP